MLGKFVTAKLKGIDDCRQGVVISMDPLRIRGQSGFEYECEGPLTLVVNPPKDCWGCGLPIGPLCGFCECKIRMWEKILTESGMRIYLRM